ITIGLVAAAAAAAQYFFTAGSGVNKLDKIIEEHKKVIERLGPAYEKAAKDAETYTRTSTNVINILLSDNAKKAKAAVKEATDTAALFAGLIHARYNVDTKPFQELIDKLQAGTISAKEFQE